MRKFSTPQDEESDTLVNLTPLIDVVFVVLVCFILIAPMLKLDSIELSKAIESQKNVSDMKTKDSIIITVFANDKLKVNERDIGLHELPAALKTLQKSYPKVTPKLLQDKKATFGMYQHVKNEVENAGFETLDIILKP